MFPTRQPALRSRQDAKDSMTHAKAGCAKLQQRLTQRLADMEAVTNKYQQVRHAPWLWLR